MTKSLEITKKFKKFQTMFWAGGLLVLLGLGLGVVDAKITVNGEWSPW